VQDEKFFNDLVVGQLLSQYLLYLPRYPSQIFNWVGHLMGELWESFYNQELTQVHTENNFVFWVGWREVVVVRTIHIGQ